MGTSAIKHSVIGSGDLKSWNSALERLSASGGRDIYFQLPYISLYRKTESEVEAYIYEEGGEVFFLPYLKYPIPSQYAEECFDIESAYGYGGPLSTSREPEFLKRAWQDFFEYAASAKIIAGFLRFHSLLRNEALAQAADVPGVQFSNTVVTLTLNKSKDAIIKDYSENTRTRVRKAERLGVAVTKGETSAFIKRFQGLYYKTMDQLNAREDYYFSDGYFAAIGTELKGSFKVYLAQVNGEDIGGALVLFSKDYISYHLSANLKEARAFEPATLLRHSVIMDALESSKQAILFGGGKTADPKDSLFVFKKGFSKETAEFYVGKLVFDRERYKAVCEQWAKLNPEKIKTYGAYFLRYKF